MKLSNSIKPANQSFASVLVALGLFGFLWPHHVNSADRHARVNIMQQNEVQQNDRNSWDNNSWYNPPRSPGFHDDFGS